MLTLLHTKNIVFFYIRFTYSQLSLKRPPLVQEKWSLKRKIKTKKYKLRNETVIYKVVAYGKKSLKVTL